MGRSLGNPKIRVASRESPNHLVRRTFYMRVETRRSVLEQQGIRVPASSGKIAKGAAPDFQVHMALSGLIAGKFHNVLFRESRYRVAAPNGDASDTESHP